MAPSANAHIMGDRAAEPRRRPAAFQFPQTAARWRCPNAFAKRPPAVFGWALAMIVLALVLAPSPLVKLAAAQGEPVAVAPSGAPAQAASQILVVNMERLLRDTDAARSIQEQAEAIRAEIQENLGARQESLREEEQELVDLRGTMDPNEFSQRVTVFEAAVRELKRDSTARGSMLQEALFNATEELKRRLRPELIRIMEERQASVMLDEREVVINARALDVTGEAIARFNEATPRIQVVWSTGTAE